MGVLPSYQYTIDVFGSAFMILFCFVVFIGSAVRASQFMGFQPYTSTAGACAAFAFLSIPLYVAKAFLAIKGGQPVVTNTTTTTTTV